MAGENDKWEFYKDAENKWRWRRKAKNGRIVAASKQGFPYKDNCIDNARRSGYQD